MGQPATAAAAGLREKMKKWPSGSPPPRRGTGGALAASASGAGAGAGVQVMRMAQAVWL